ncbi:MAG: nitroreductase family protein, partial [Thermoplasmatota archaeon]
MEIFEAIKERRSVRSYKNKDVSKEKIEKLIEAAIWAP